MPLSSRCLCTSFWCKYLWFKHAVHGHRICSASLNLSLMKLMKDCTPPIYLGVNSTPCTQLLSIYNKNCRAYISAALEPLYGLSNYRTELNRESKIIPIQVRWGEGTAACQTRSQVGANGYRAGEAFTESRNQPPSVITRRGLHHCRRSTVSSYMATL